MDLVCNNESIETKAQKDQVMYSYSIFKVNLDESLSHRENVSSDEMEARVWALYGVFATIKVLRSDGNFIIYTDNGEEFVVSTKGKE